MLNRMFTFKKVSTLVLIALCMTGAVSAQPTLVDLSPPVSIGSLEPNLTRLPDGRILISRTEPVGADFAVKTAILAESVWLNRLSLCKPIISL